MDRDEKLKFRKGIVLPGLQGVDLLRKICLHPSKSSKHKSACHKIADARLVSPVSTRPPSTVRIHEENKGRKRRPSDAFTKFLLSHPEDRPWRRDARDLPLWDERESLNNEASLITTEICSRFCDWYRSLGGSAVIDEERVAQLFEIRIPPYEPKLDKRRTFVQLKGRESVDKRHLQRPNGQKPQKYEPPRHLLSMQQVFEDIADLEITKAYCQHIKETPGTFKPPFLVDGKFAYQ